MFIRFTGVILRDLYAAPDFDYGDANDGDASALSMICLNTNIRQGREIGPV
jgi:hypothetical protein